MKRKNKKGAWRSRLGLRLFYICGRTKNKRIREKNYKRVEKLMRAGWNE